MHKGSQRPFAHSFALFILSLAGATTLLSGCGSGFTVKDPSYYAAISASATTIRAGQQMQIVNNQKNTGVPLTFSVNGVPGGNSEFGTITAMGSTRRRRLFQFPNRGHHQRGARHPSCPPGTLTLSILNPIPILTAVTPTGFSEGTTTVTVSGSAVCLRRADQLERHRGSHHVVSDTQLVAAIPAPNPGTFPLLVTNPIPVRPIRRRCR